MKTLVYRYGLLAPTVKAEEVGQQIFLAHRYQNTLIALERDRRTARDTIIAAVPEIAVFDAQIVALEAELEVERVAILKLRADARSKKPGDPTRSKAIIVALKKLRTERKGELKKVLETGSLQPQLDGVGSAHKVAVKAARAACGVYWGTYLQIEASVEQSSKAIVPPKFQRWTAGGAVSVQLMKGLPVAKAFECTDTRLRIDVNPLPVPDRCGKPLPRLLLRVGSTEKREPIFAEWPLILHRPLPEGVFKWAKVVRRRIGAHDQWSIHFTLTMDETPMQEGAPLAVNLRWAKTVEAGESVLLAADYRSDFTSGKISLDPAVVSMLKKSDDLRSIRDKNFDAEKARLGAAVKLLTLPEELKTRLEFLHLWKAQGKLAAVMIWWRTNRFPGDEVAFTYAEAWRKQDKHLWEWEANSRRKALARRRDQYRVFASQMVKNYKVLIIEKFNISRVAIKPKPEEEREFSAVASAQRFAVAPSELKSSLVNAFRREGGTIVEVPAGMTSTEMLAYYYSQGAETVAAAASVSERTKRLLKNKGKPSR